VVRSEEALISFGAGAQTGDIHISDIAGGNLDKLTVISRRQRLRASTVGFVVIGGSLCCVM
jgi:hypothetical protein